MDDSPAFARKLEVRLDARRESLDRTELPKLKAAFKLFQTAFHGIYAVLEKKGLVHEDPYKYDLKISEVQVPPEGPFPESEKSDQMSLRMSQLDSYLDFLNNYYQFDVDFISLGRIKRLLALVKYFNFTQFVETSTSVNTKALAEYVASVRKGSDQLSGGILAESVSQLDKSTRDILSCLKELTAYHRERYKLELRYLLGTSLRLEAGFVASRKDEALKQVKRRLAEASSPLPFYPELVEEYLLEDYGEDSTALQEAVLARFAPVEEKKVERSKERSYKGVILDGVRALSGINISLESGLQKLSEASNLVESRNQGFMSKLKTAIRKFFSPGDLGRHYDIDVLDPVTGSTLTESLDFGAFLEEGSRKVRSLSGLLQKNGPAWKRLETMPDDQAFKFLERTMEELQSMLRRMAGLEESLREAAAAEDRGRIRSTKTEITAIKGALIKANQKKHEYVAQKEEIEQMRRLGISSD